VKSGFRELGALVCAAAFLAPAAFADLKAYNAAVKAGDYKTAAIEAEATWKTWNTNDEQTALLAREFGFAALVSGRNDLARQFGEFLVEKGATLPTPDDQPAISAVLFRLADFKLKSGDGERRALREALLARSAAGAADMTSVLSWEALYVGDWNVADWESAVTDAAAAADFMKRQKALQVRQREAEIVSASAAFLRGRGRVTKGRNDFYTAIADVHDAIVADINTAASPSTRSQLFEAKWKAEAWALAIASYLESSYTQIGSNISTALEPRPLVQPQLAQHPENPADAQRPLCEGKFDGRKLVYPSSKEYQGLVGSVIARMETDATGKVTNTEVLAAVPLKSFSDQVVRTMNTWTYKPAKDVDTTSCRLNSRNHNFRVIFRIG
jgi:TonB family protein